MTSTEIRDMLLGPPSAHEDNCDRCKARKVDTWANCDPRFEGETAELFCAPCWRSIAAKQSAPRPSAPVQWHRQKQLLTGLDCAPGQGDLFDTNGSK